MKKISLLLGLVVLATACIVYIPREYSGDSPGSGERGRYDYPGSRYIGESGPEYFYDTLSPFAVFGR